MALKGMTQGDKEYYKRHLDGAVSFQGEKFLSKIDLDLFKAYYEGREQKSTYFFDSDTEESEKDAVFLNKVFPSVNRITPTLYYQDPRIVFTPTKNSSEFSSKIATAAINYDYREMRIKQENHAIIRDAYFAGFGGCKIGYQTGFVFKKQAQNNEMRQFFGLPDKEEKIIDYIEYEGPWVKRIKPTDIFRDHKQPAGEDRIIWIRYNRSLDDVIKCGMYEYDTDFFKYFNRKDDREVDLEIFEGWIRTREGLFITAFCKGYDKPIRWEKSSWLGDGFPLVFLSFAEVNDEHYPPSFMQIVKGQQKNVNYLTRLQLRIIDKFRNQVGINEKALAEGAKNGIRKNTTGGIIWFKEPPGPHVSQITSAPIPADLFNVSAIMQDNLQECLSVSGLRLGSTKAEQTLGQDQLIEMGNQLGLYGLQDKVKEFVKEQATKLLQMRKQFSTAPSLVPIVGMEIKNPMTGQLITDEWLEFGTPNNPISLKQTIAGDYDVTVDIKSAQKPDEISKLKLFEGMIDRLLAIEPRIMQDGKKLDFKKLIKVWMGLYKEFISNAEGFIVDIPPEEQQQIQEAQADQKSVMDEQAELELEGKELENEGKNLENVNKVKEMTFEQLMGAESVNQGR